MPHVRICMIQLPNKLNSAINATYSRDVLQMYVYILQINWIFSS